MGPYIVGVGGTTRPGSSTEKALAAVLSACEWRGAVTRAFAGQELSGLPLFAPERPERSDGARELMGELRRADGIVIASPGYHGSVSGLVKNAVDYVEDLREAERPYFAEQPVGCVVTGAGWQGIVSALEHLRSIVHALRGWPTPLGAGINTSEAVFASSGQVIDEKAAFQLDTVGAEIMQFVSWRGSH